MHLSLCNYLAKLVLLSLFSKMHLLEDTVRGSTNTVERGKETEREIPFCPAYLGVGETNLVTAVCPSLKDEITVRFAIISRILLTLFAYIWGSRRQILKRATLLSICFVCRCPKLNIYIAFLWFIFLPFVPSSKFLTYSFLTLPPTKEYFLLSSTFLFRCPKIELQLDHVENRKSKPWNLNILNREGFQKSIPKLPWKHIIPYTRAPSLISGSLHRGLLSDNTQSHRFH